MQNNKEEEEEKKHGVDDKDIIVVPNEASKKKDDENNNKNGNKLPKYSPLYVDCDFQRINQVVFNLLDNAIKFTAEGLIVVSTALQRCIHVQNDNRSSDNNNNEAIKIRSTYTDESKGYKSSIIVTIDDAGLGVNPTIKDQLFEKFATRSTQGTGLGLYLSKKIIEAHGGKIWYEDPNDDKATKEIGSYNDDSNEDNINNNNNNKDKKNQKTGSIFRFSLPVPYQ